MRWHRGIRGIDLAPESVPALIDELPALMVVAALADGVTRIRGAAELRVKESDRIAVMAGGLARLGFTVRERPDGMDIEGRPQARGSGDSDTVEVDAAGDHRCAMSFAVLAQALGTAVRIRGAAHIATSYPGFVRDLSALGGAVSVEEEAAHV
jgi:3-phosphoshikimate 1-carboxyvinyltransferase